MHATAADLQNLARVGILKEAGHETMETLLPCLEWRYHEAGNVILHFEDRSDNVYFVTEGSTRVTLCTPEGWEVLFRDIAAGDFFGELAAIDGEPRSVRITALVRTRLAALPGPAFVAAVLACPGMCRALLRHMSRRIREHSFRLLEFAALPVRERLCSELLRLSRPRSDGTGAAVVSPPLPHHVLAARIGTHREVVAREMSALARRGVIASTRQAIIIPDPRLLRFGLAKTAH